MSETTESVIVSMLTENTGTHFLDSGGFYGRHWQRNQGRDFASEPSASVSVDGWGKGKDRFTEVSIVLNLYHFLVNNLDYEPELDARLGTIIDESDRDTSYDECIKMFFDALHAEDREVTGPEGSDHPSGEYTYNTDNLLSQDFIYTYFDLDGDPYVVLQIHGGCDARGGFTAPRVFSLYESYGLSFYTDASMGCDTCRAYWDTDDAYHLYYEGNSSASMYDLAGMIPLDVDDYDPDDASMVESRIMRFGYEFYMRWADREDRLRRLVARVRNLPQRTLQRVINWAERKNPNKRTLHVRAYSRPIMGKRTYHVWVYSAKHETVLKIAQRIERKFHAVRPNYPKRVLMIKDHKATCPVCGKGTLVAAPLHY